MVDRRRSFFDDIFGTDTFEDIEDMIRHMIESIGTDELPDRPFVYGFSVTQRPGEEPAFREFGNVPPDREMEQPEAHAVHIGERKPLIDVLETEDNVHVIAEMPGIEKKDIRLDATESVVDLHASHGERKYSEHIDLPVKVDPDSAEATYKNGVLEVIFRRMESEKRTSVKIK